MNNKYNHNYHQQKQVVVINALEEQIKNNMMSFSTVAPVDNYVMDTRICLTSIHLPNAQLIEKVQKSLIEPLREISPDYFYYPTDSLHMTVKNIRVINDPPHFTKEDIRKAKNVFSSVIHRHRRFHVYFYRLLLFPNNLALIGTTDSELDSIVLDLDKELNKAGVPDDKKYMNSHYFFSNMTLARFNNKPNDKFLRKIEEISDTFSLEPYVVDSITLLTCTAVFQKRNIIQTWQLNAE